MDSVISTSLTKAVLLAVLLAALMSLAACSSQGINIKHLAKSDVDMISEIVLLETRAQLKLLLGKFYKRNPRQLALADGMTLERRLQMIYGQPGRLIFAELQGRQELDAIKLAFDKDFTGDRVFALMVGLTAMIRQSYNYQTEFYIVDNLDAQKLYNSARNIEVLAWKLEHRLNAKAQPFLVTSRHDGVIDNMSFERLYGKLIYSQDIMAAIISDKNNRAINTVIKGSLSIFLPI